MKVDFFIVGAPKSGTTSLYHYLNEHPEIQMSSQKEPDFFTDLDLYNSGMYYGKNRIDTIEKYHNLFKGSSKLRGEASVSYLFYDGVAKKIKNYNSDAKIIIMLRNPIERAFSHYLMDYRLGLVSDSFEDVIDYKSKHKNAKLFYQQYIEVSEYFKQIKRYLDVFKTESVLFIDYEDLKRDVSDVVDRTHMFLGVDVFEPNNRGKHNTYNMPKNNIIRFFYSFVGLRNFLIFIFPKSFSKKIRTFLFRKDKKPKLSCVTRKKLYKHFEKDVIELGKLLNKDFSSWISDD